jgi:hypothetical protein
MHNQQEIENIFKQELQDSNAPYNEALWSKLNDDLLPVRDKFKKQQRRRLAAYISLALLALSSVGGYMYYKNQQAKANKTCAILQTAAPKGCCSKPTQADRFGLNPNVQFEANSNTAPNTITDNTNTDNSTNVKALNNTATIYNSAEVENNKPAPIASKHIPVKYKQQVNSTNNTAKGNKEKNSNTKTNPVETIISKNSINQNNEQLDLAIVDDDNNTTVTKPENDNSAIPTSSAPAINTDKSSTPQPPIAKSTTAKKPTPKPTTSKSSWSVLAGVNATSSFDKTSYFTGVLWQKTIQDKSIFAGLKVAKNNLHHQLLSIDKTGTTPTAPDAIINKLTTVQLPFGYTFSLNKKAAHPTNLMLGFEPTLLTGIETIYYDNNGVPGGPTTMVRNSPLLINAINKFNVSFLIGAEKMLSNKIGLFANAGYGLINITDKQFYNKAGSFNNLKYIQAGLKVKLNK